MLQSQCEESLIFEILENFWRGFEVKINQRDFNQRLILGLSKIFVLLKNQVPFILWRKNKDYRGTIAYGLCTRYLLSTTYQYSFWMTLVQLKVQFWQRMGSPKVGLTTHFWIHKNYSKSFTVAFYNWFKLHMISDHGLRLKMHVSLSHSRRKGHDNTLACLWMI